MVFEGNRLLIINELIKETEFIAAEDLKERIKIINSKIDRRGIDRDHLIPLRKEGLIECGSIPRPRNNKPPKMIDAVRISHRINALHYLLEQYPDIYKLHTTPFIQSMINEDLAEHLIKKFYPLDFDNLTPPITKAADFPLVAGLVKKLIRLLRISPTALKIAIEEGPQQRDYDWDFFEARLLAAVLLDWPAMVNGSLYTRIEGKIELNIGNESDDKYIEAFQSLSMDLAKMRSK